MGHISTNLYINEGRARVRMRTNNWTYIRHRRNAPRVGPRSRLRPKIDAGDAPGDGRSEKCEAALGGRTTKLDATIDRRGGDDCTLVLHHVIISPSSSTAAAAAGGYKHVRSVTPPADIVDVNRKCVYTERTQRMIENSSS